MSKEQFLSRLNKLKIKMVDYFHLLFKSTHYNYYRMETCRKDETGRLHCDISFDSYAALRKFQNRLRKVSLGLGTLVMATVFASLTINLLTGPILNSFAATFDFGQSDWSGGASVEYPNHATDQSGWNKYSSKDASVVAGAQITLAAASNSITQTDDGITNTGFNLAGNIYNQTVATGTAASASVALQNMSLSAGTRQVVTGGNHTCVLKTDGSVWCWGYNVNGQLGDNTITQRNVPTQVFGLTAGTVKEIAAGGSNTCALKTDGSMMCWGYNVNGQVGDNTTTERHIPTQVSGLTAGTVKEIAAGGSQVCALKTDGSAWCWGGNIYGTIGDNTITDRHIPTQVSGLTAGIVKEIVAASTNTCALKTDGSMMCWGSNGNGQIGDNTTTQRNIPTQVSGLTAGTVKEIAAGDNFACAVKTDGSAFCWGQNNVGKLGDNTIIDKYIPTQVSGLTAGTVKEIAAGSSNACALKTDGSMMCWGSNTRGKLGDNTIIDKYIPTQVSGLTAGTVKEIAAGSSHNCALKTDSSVLCWGRNTSGQLGDNTVTDRYIPTQVSGLTAGGGQEKITGGDDYACALKADGSVMCWGDNTHGQIGDNTTTQRNIPTQVSGLTTGTVKEISTGDSHVCVLRVDGSVMCWGGNAGGQLGDNTTIQKNIPTQVSGLTAGTVKEIKGGYDHTCALKTDGSMVCWGQNSIGSIGDNTTTQRLVPTQVSGLTAGTVREISVGQMHTCALKTDGSALCWGYNAYGQIGDNSLTSRYVPTQVSGLTAGTVDEIREGYTSTYAIKTDGSMVSWGRNNNGQLGDNTIVNKSVPTQVSGLTAGTVKEITGGGIHACAIKTDSSMVCWGYNDFGQLGDNSTTQKNIPTQVFGLTSGMSIRVTAGDRYTCAVKADSSVQCWGYNIKGQLGDNTLVDKLIPNQVSSLTAPGGVLYSTSGTFTSGIIDVGQKVSIWNNLSWTSTNANPGSCGDPIVDSRDGKIYDTVMIGDQCWTAKNMDIGTMLASGATLPSNNSAIEKWCYDNSDANCATDGGLYTWAEANQLATTCDTTTCTPPTPSQGICPTGWHLPTHDEYTTMERSICTSGSCATDFPFDTTTTGYRGTNESSKLSFFTLNGTNSSGFSGLLAGYRETNGIFYSRTTAANFWSAAEYSATNAWRRVLVPSTATVFRGNFTKPAGFSVRCVSDSSSVGDSGSIALKVRSSANADMSGATDWASCGQIYNGASLTSASPNCVNAGDRYIQYQAVLATTDTASTPTLDDITFQYSGFNASNTLTSSAYNTQDSANAMGNIVWTPSSLPAGTEIKFQVRTAPDLAGAPGTWTDWEGPDGTSASYFTDNTGGQAMPANFSADDDDQWFQYMITMISDGISAPSLSNVNVIYVVNASPTVSNVIAGQVNANQTVSTPQGDILAATGTVVVSASVLDLDTDAGTFDGGSMRNKLEISMKYFNTNSQTWENVATTSIQGMPDNFILDQISSSTPRNFNLIWNPRVEFNNQSTSSDFKIQILANDKEGANNIGASSSPVFAIDTKVPTADNAITSHEAIKVDARKTDAMVEEDINISIKADDDSILYYRYSLSSSTVDGLLQGDGINSDSGQWLLNSDVKTGTTTTIKVAAVGQSRASAVYIQYTDEFGNLDPTVYDITIPASVTSIIVQDITNAFVTPSDVKFFLSWSESGLPTDGINGSDSLGEFNGYYLERADSPGTVDFVPVDADYHVISSTTDKTINYFLDNNILEDHYYYYRIYIKDGIGNFSQYTNKNDAGVVILGVPNGIQDVGEGGGGTAVGVAPIITSVEIAETLTTQAEIIWNTDVLSNSSVEYIATSTVPTVEDFANAPFKGVATMLQDTDHYGKHRVTVDGLDSNTTYYFRVKSTSVDSIEGTSFDETYHFTTLDGPVIASSTINVQNKTNNSLTIIWDTDIPANSFVGYSIDPNMTNPVAIESGQEDSVTNHSVTLANLTQGTRYYFYVKSGSAKDNNLSQYYSDMTTSDATAPINTAVTSQVKRTSATISWQADELSTSLFSYGTSAGNYTVDANDNTLTTTHLVSLDNLSASTTYYFQLFSVDTSGNVSATTTGQFTTDGVNLTNVMASTTSETAVKITWNTDEDTSSQVQYGTDLATLLLAGTLEPAIPSDLTRNHEISINGLTQSTKYYYRVISTIDGFTTNSPIYSFTSGDLVAPIISDIVAINIGTDSATINWQTDENANSTVEWGTETGIYTASTSSAVMTRTHSINITGLNTYTDYYFHVISSDGNSNATTSTEQSFKTTNFKITNVFASSATTTATISWDTDELSSSQVEYTRSADFTNTSLSTDATATTTHSMELADLYDGSVYYYKVRSIKDGHTQESPIYTFSTSDQTAPVIDQQPQAVTIADKTATVYWGTDELSDSTVYYTTTPGGQYLTANATRLTTLHFVTLSDLIASTTYYYYIESKDGGTNTATSTERTFTTLSTQVSHVDLINPGNPIVVQKTDTEAVITIPVTNTTATSKLCYATTGNIDIENCVGQTILTPTRTHTYYLADLTASTTYYVKTKTIDSENSAINFTSAEINFLTRPPLFTDESSADLQSQIDALEVQLADKVNEVTLLQEQLASATDGMYTDAEMQVKLTMISELEAQLAAANARSGGGTLVIDKTDKVAPTISNVKIAEVGDVYAKITWDTNEESSSMVGYGFSSAYEFADSDYQSYLKRIKNHTVYLNKLSPDTTYHFSTVSADSWGNMSSSPDFTLTTLAAGEETKKNIATEAKKEAENTLTKIQQMINELLKTGKVNPEDIRSAIQKTGEPPMISGNGPEISNVTAKSATITWKTDRKSNSIISYYIESMGRDTAEQVGNYSALVTDHTVNISNLAPGRKYIFTAQSVDALGNIGASDQGSFETTGIPFVSEVSMSNITNNSVDISWLSNIESTSELDYGTSVAYGQSAKNNSDSLVLNHNLRLNDLKPGQTYHFKAKGANKKGDIISSDDYTFTTLTSFDVLTYSINKVTDKSVNIIWKTTNESTSEVEYTNTVTKITDSVKSGDFTREHDIRLTNLLPGTKYTFKIKGKDRHDQATESEGLEYSTLIDAQAPIIEYVQTDMALISKGDQNSVQAVVTWKTNEPSTSEIIYTEGGAKNLPILDSDIGMATGTNVKIATEEVNIGNDKFTVAKDSGSLTQKHVLVITDFKPSTVYTFKARSIDEAGNVSYSKDYTILAPSKEESVLQIIIKTFEDTFGWLKMK